MTQTLRAGFAYFAIVMGTGFMLGVIRVPFLVPRMGDTYQPHKRYADYADMLADPALDAVIITPAKSVTAGLLAFVLTVGAELGLALVLQDRSLGEYVASRDKVSGSVYLALLLVFAFMPRLRLSSFSRTGVEQRCSKP